MTAQLLSFPAVLRGLVADDPDAIAVIIGDETITRAELDRRSNQVARAYAARGVGSGDWVTIALPNSVDWFLACMAAWKLGAIPNPISPALPPRERDTIVARAKPKLVVGVDAIDDGTGLADDALPDVTSPVERVLASGGSTGTPKLILSQAPASLDPATPLSMFNARRVALIPGPTYHGIPFSSAWRSLFAGALVVVMPRFDASACLALIERHRVDRISFVPTMMQRISKLPADERAGRDMTSLEFVLTSGSPCPAWLMREWIEWLGPEVMHESFGSTERLGGTFINGTEWLAHPGSVGRAFMGSLIRILDPETGEECPPGTMGEIYMMPPTGPNTSYSYVGAHPRSTRDGWESVGDMGYLDADGYLFLGDRRADMIIRGGQNIYPAEIEAVLDRHPAVRSSAVIGLPHDDLGQYVHAIVEADPAVVAADELIAHVREHLVHYKVPATIELVDRPLRDDSGKVRRTALREQRIANEVQP